MTISRDRQIDQAFRRRLIRNVTLRTDNRSATGLNTRNGSVKSLRVPVSRDDAGPFSRKERCHRKSHSGASARDHRHFPLQSHGCLLLYPAKRAEAAIYRHNHAVDQAGLWPT
jgi:hypothetical protein